MIKLETDEERKFTSEAYDLGCKAVKFVDPASRNAPDRMVFCPNGRVIFFEFKVKGKKSRKGQRTYQQGLSGLGFEVHEVYTCDQAIAILKKFLCIL